MLSECLPTLDETLSYYDIPYKSYILMFHPVTTDKNIGEYSTNLVEAVLEDNGNYIAVNLIMTWEVRKSIELCLFWKVTPDFYFSISTF